MRIRPIADDPLARAGLAAMLTEQEEIEIAMQLAADDSTPAGVPDVYAPDMVLWDFGVDSGLSRLNCLQRMESGC